MNCDIHFSPTYEALGEPHQLASHGIAFKMSRRQRSSVPPHFNSMIHRRDTTIYFAITRLVQLPSSQSEFGLLQHPMCARNQVARLRCGCAGSLHRTCTSELTRLVPKGAALKASAVRSHHSTRLSFPVALMTSAIGVPLPRAQVPVFRLHFQSLQTNKSLRRRRVSLRHRGILLSLSSPHQPSERTPDPMHGGHRSTVSTPKATCQSVQWEWGIWGKPPAGMGSQWDGMHGSICILGWLPKRIGWDTATHGKPIPRADVRHASRCQVASSGQ
ncbi:hypothetical protein K456DRAFT_1924576 [Colletotrichum gloeosporioides 23]|nr:hypothetical protein K456DRAFT_1924576 [Colletotrichum gloeosporioides 23]